MLPVVNLIFFFKEKKIKSTLQFFTEDYIVALI